MPFSNGCPLVWKSHICAESSTWRSGARGALGPTANATPPSLPTSFFFRDVILPDDASPALPLALEISVFFSILCNEFVDFRFHLIHGRLRGLPIQNDFIPSPLDERVHLADAGNV